MLILLATTAQAARFTIRVTPDMRRHTNILYALYFIGSAYSMGVLYLVLRTRIAHRLRDVARRIVKWKPATTFMTFALLSIVIVGHGSAFGAAENTESCLNPPPPDECQLASIAALSAVRLVSLQLIVVILAA